VPTPDPTPLAPTTPNRATRDAARADAAAAAELSSVAIRLVHTLDEARAVSDLFDRAWHTSGNVVIPVEVLWALAHGGNYAAGAYDRDSDALLAASMGFFTSPPGRTMHSDATGTDPAGRDRGLGMALKLHQRAWALDLGLREITWTFDPLVARNAHFNLVKLGADVVEYCVDFYGAMDDGLNAGQGSDRLLVSWDVRAPVGSARGLIVERGEPLLVDDDGRPAPQLAGPDARRVTVAVPHDIVEVRAADPDRARAWRVAVRETLGAELGQGGRVVGFASPQGYVVERPDAGATA
jgi:predicted GNAT superfamily acetyltransferase